jgi:uncharacterized protein (DUF1684 family)
MKATLLLSFLLLGCSKPADEPAALPTGEEWVESVQAWRSKHETDYRRDWATIAGLHFLEPGSHSIGSAKASDIVLPADLPASVGSVTVAGGWVRFEPAPGINPLQNGQPLSGTIVLKEPGKEAADEVALRRGPGQAGGDVKFAVHESGPRLSLRVWDPDGKQAREFAGFEWFPIDPNYRVVARFIPDAKPINIPVLNTYGDADVMPSEGIVEFTLNGEMVRMRPFTTRPKRFYFVFRDASSGHETYETARFLYSDLRDDGTTVMDFNQAYNPPCAFNPYTTCPIPLKENRLAVKILAGEKAYKGHE